MWRELHELFRYAADNHLLESDPAEVDAGGVQDAIAAAYKEAILVALASPYQLPRRQLPLAIRVAGILAPLVEIRFTELQGARQPFAISPDQDKPPRPVSQAGHDWRSGGEWLIGTVLVGHKLSEVLAGQEDGARVAGVEGAQGVARELLLRLSQSWNEPARRQFRRQAAQAVVDVCSGAARISRLLEIMQQVQAEYVALGQMNIPWEKIPRVAEAGLQEWELVNQSAAGLRMRSKPGEGAGIAVGELISIQHRGMPGTSLAVIRWAQAQDDGTVEFGAQMVAPRVEPLQLDPVLNSRGPIRALLVPEIPALNLTTAIAAPPGTHRDGRDLQAIQGVMMRTVRATTLLEHTDCYELFAFDPG